LAHVLLTLRQFFSRKSAAHLDALGPGAPRQAETRHVSMLQEYRRV
jgi:hypothetical protein